MKCVPNLNSEKKTFIQNKNKIHKLFNSIISENGAALAAQFNI